MDLLQPVRLAHLSDLHFSHLKIKAKDFLSKRWIGQFNLLLRRKKDFNYSLLDPLPALLQKEGIQTALLSGDLTCTSSQEEFLLARNFIQALEAKSIQTLVIPGNHDHYTKKAYQQRVFYQFFPTPSPSFPWSLKEDHLAIYPLSPPSWYLILLDTTLATPLLCSHGRFTEQLEQNLKKALETSLPPHANVMVANHFPLHSNTWRPALQRKESLLQLLKAYPQIRCYLHGHDHQHRILDLRKEGLPILTDAGSTTHHKRGSWTLIECQRNTCSFQPFFWNQGWTFHPNSKTSFSW